MYNPYTPQMQRLQQMEQQYPQYAQQNAQSYPQNPQTYPQSYVQPIGLQGKSVDSVDVVKAMDIPLDGSVSYFPLTDGSAIVTKQLQADGTSKTTIYKPFAEPPTPVQQVKYVTEEQVLEMLDSEPEHLLELQEEIKDLKRQLRDISEDMKELKRAKESKRKGDE